MLDMIQHMDRIEESLSNLSKKNKGKFGSWCVDFIFRQPDITQGFDSLESREMFDFIQSSIDFIRSSKDDPFILEEYISKADRMGLEDIMEGGDELLGALSSMLVGYQIDDAQYIANCAERALNYMDHAKAPPSSSQEEYQSSMLELADAQVRMLDLLQQGATISGIKE
ncbi:Uncharacterised protein [Delftia tsuruhatensis]|uniref:hypothetical protein n=1 Tax=Delftia tsuruhatensis TaxID=180282 RepID=UPI001E767D44|nr:hypothetical protein [Delftia tsuruhatensis]CAB5723539.1 Uncharacterised protein [Delftia tsuruhatensis]CAC9693317.1 Uncharacterised protein [Delftia tsuruhatensis]